MVFFERCQLLGSTLALCLATLLIVLSVDALPSLSSNNQEVDSAFFHIRPRLGYFPDVEGYLKIYEDYFTNVLKVNDKALSNVDINDWRNVRPTGELCVNFLQGFQVRNYKLSKPFDIIPLDACLGWIFDESSEKTFDLDRFNKATKEQSESVSKDPKLKEIYSTTNFKGDRIIKELKESLYSYFLRLLKIHSDNPRSGCHSLWLEAYNDFIEDVYLQDCDDEEEKCLFYGVEGADTDSYLTLIAESTKLSSKNCYNVMQKQLVGLMHAAYEDESIYNKMKASKNKAVKQSEAMKWSREMIQILQLVTGTDPEKTINLKRVVSDLSDLKRGDEKSVEKFTEALGNYAIQKVNLKDSANDYEGRGRYGKAMTKLCKPYIDPGSFLAQTGGSTLGDDDPNSTRKPFEFYHIINSLIRLTNHVSFYGIEKDKFEEDVIKNGWEALYLATFACQIISTTWGELDYGTNQGLYQVFMRPNARVLIEDWPIEVMNSKLSISKDVEEDEKEAQISEVKPKGSKNKIKIPSWFSDTSKQVPEPKREHKAQKVDLPSAPKPTPPSASKPAPPLAPKPAPPSALKQSYPVQPSIPIESVENGLDADVNQMFKKLHGRYPKNRVGEEFPSQERLNAEIYKDNPTQRRRQPEDNLPVPLAFNLDEDFLGGRSKYAEDTSESVEKVTSNPWADLDAMSI